MRRSTTSRQAPFRAARAQVIHLGPVIVVLAAAGCTVLAAGCTPGADQRAPLRPFNGITVPSAADRETLHHAEEQAIARCMRQRGLAYTPAPHPNPYQLTTASPYGLLQLDQARANGYGITANALAVAGNPAATANDTLLASLSATDRQRWTQALTGTPDHREKLALPDGRTLEYRTDGCIHLATLSVYGPQWRRLDALAQNLSTLVTRQVTGDRRYRTAERIWADCMTSHGYRYRRLTQPPATVRAQLTAARADPRRLRRLANIEAAMAAADASCQRSAGLHQAVTAAQPDAERRIATDQHRHDLSRLSTLRRHAVRRATATRPTGLPAGKNRADPGCPEPCHTGE